MAEKDEARPGTRAEAVRGAAVQAFQATAGQAGVTRERAQELADELAQAAGRFRGALDELRPATAEDIRTVRDEVHALERRLAALEAAAPATTAAPSPAAPATKSVAPKKAMAKKPAAAKKAAAAKKPAAAKKSAAKKKPSATRTPRSST
jgi:polyhydroxyalkanoate synthesis regulator phasin